MGIRRIVAMVVFAWLGFSGMAMAESARVRSRNFIVEAPTAEMAREFAQLAEEFRRSKAMEWIGREMPDWQSPCPLVVTPTLSGAGGATSFNFDDDGRGGMMIRQKMHIEGSLERLKNSVLPHEITHTVFAHHFRQPVARWADEGGSVYSEDDLERRRHDQMCRQILNAGKGFPLKRLLNLKDYPKDVMVLYAEGYSVTRFLVEQKDRKTFLNFVGHGMSERGWDDAVRVHYGYRDVNELEQVWLESLRRPNGPIRDIASATPAVKEPTAMVTRSSAPPARPVLDPPIVARGQSGPADTSANRRDQMTGWLRPTAQLGSPEIEPLPPETPRNPMTQTVSSTSPATPPARNRPLPPPVILFPPE